MLLVFDIPCTVKPLLLKLIVETITHLTIFKKKLSIYKYIFAATKNEKSCE